MSVTESFRFDYDPGTIVYGRDCVAGLERELARLESERALVITGTIVGRVSTVIDPVRDGIGTRLAGVFAETTPDKRLTTALDGADQLRKKEADAVVSLGGGSSLDIATVASVLAGDNRPRDTIRAEFRETGTISITSKPLPILVVPTTLAGADLSITAGITDRMGMDTETLTRGGIFDRRLMPAALFYDPTLIETTPHQVLCASAMNGFDKGIESLYARNATPITDATASRGLSLLKRGLPEIGVGRRNEETLHDAIVGTMLVQYGASRATETTLSLIHAFGHGIARGYAIQQGGAHAIIAPHALRFLFEHTDGRRDMLADALGVESNEDPDATAEAVIEAVVEVRDALRLPRRLQSIDDLSKEDLPTIASEVATDGFISNTPPELETTEEELERVLQKAW